MRVLEQKSDLVNEVLHGFMSHIKETKKTLLFPSAFPTFLYYVSLFFNKGDLKARGKMVIVTRHSVSQVSDFVFAPHCSTWTWGQVPYATYQILQD